MRTFRLLTLPIDINHPVNPHSENNRTVINGKNGLTAAKTGKTRTPAITMIAEFVRFRDRESSNIGINGKPENDKNGLDAARTGKTKELAIIMIAEIVRFRREQSKSPK